MNNYRVNFYKMPEKKKENKPGVQEVVNNGNDEIQHLGSVVVDDCGTDRFFTIQSKAFRRAAPVCQMANKVTVDKL